MKHTLTTRAMKFFEFSLPAAALALIYCAVTISSMEVYDAARLYMRTYAMMEHVLMSLVLITGGGLLLDLYERRHHS